MTLTVGSLFSGIGGIDLGLERAGMKVAWQVELDPWCQRVLAKHWPDVERFADVKEVGAHNLASVDVIAGGFPCQDLSYAGKGAGITGARSGLWSEYARVIRELRPRYVFVENVPALLSRGLGVVLGDLAACGYDAEWDCIPAAAVGAPHRRDRVWLLAYPASDLRRAPRHDRPSPSNGSGAGVPHSEGDGWRSRRSGRPAAGGEGQPQPIGPLAHPDNGGRMDRQVGVLAAERGLDALSEPVTGGTDVADAAVISIDPVGRRVDERSPAEARQDGLSRQPRRGGLPGGWTQQWATEPNVGRVAHGVPARVDRLRGLGNAVVPAVVQWIGERIVACEEGQE